MEILSSGILKFVRSIVHSLSSAGITKTFILLLHGPRSMIGIISKHYILKDNRIIIKKKRPGNTLRDDKVIKIPKD